MKHSAKAAARLAREREKQARRNKAAGAARGTAAATAAGTAARYAGSAEQRPAAPDPADAPVTSGRPTTGTGTGRVRATAASTVAAAAVTARPSAVAAARTGTASPAATAATSVAGGRPHAARPRIAQLPYALVLAGLVAGLALMQGGSQDVKSGTLVIAGAVLAGSLTRLILPDGRAGLLRSRRRLVDVALLSALGAGLLIAGLIVQVPG